jgi:hypothetical protein
MDSALRPKHDSRLPNLIVVIDLRDGEPTRPSLFALSEGRRVAHTAGATIYAIVMSDGGLDDETTARLGRAGADRVLLCEGPGLGAAPLDATHGAALLAAIERVPPLLVLFPAGGPGADLGPMLAARMGAAFAGYADLEVGEARTPLADGVGRVFLRRWRRDRSGYRRLDPVELERPVVALLPADTAPAERGTDDVEVEVMSCPPPAKVSVTELSSEPDELGDIPLASTLIVVDPRLDPAAVDTLRAAATGGVVVVDAVKAGCAVAASAPRTLLAVGTHELAVTGTPRGRVGLVLPARTPTPARPTADIVYAAAAPTSTADLLREVGAALAPLAEDPNR